MKKQTKHSDLIQALMELLQQASVSTQQAICEALEAQGFSINQSKISRLLDKLAAVKVKNAHGQTIYRLPKEVPPPTQTPLNQLILKIDANESMVIIQTSPGSAPLIARMLDYQDTNSEILATLAGDDTIFVAPKSVKRTQAALSEIKELLAAINPLPK